MRAFLEHNDVGDWLDDFVYMSKYRLIDLGFEVVPFNGDDPEALSKHNIDKNEDVIIGSVQATVEFFKQAQVEVPSYIGYPNELKKYLSREVCIARYSELKEMIYPFFIKPVNDVKLFTGDVINQESNLDTLKMFTPEIDNNTEVYVSEVLNIESEYRCFVFENELRGIHHYLGDFRKYPNCDLIDQMIEDYKDNSPVAYTIDVGVTDEGETILIEVNDMWAIGSYGFDAKLYTLMCVRRMKQILKG